MTLRFPNNFWRRNGATTSDGQPVYASFSTNWDTGDDTVPGPFCDLNWGSPREQSHEEPLLNYTVNVPDNYEPNYAYPLVVWLHDDGGSELDALTLLPALSTQNYIGLGIRGNAAAKTPSPSGYGWSNSRESMAILENIVPRCVGRIGRDYHIHTERIYLAGFGDGASMAMELLLSRPAWFSGAVALGGPLPRQKNLLARYRMLSGQRMLIGAGVRDKRMPITEVVRAGRLLHAAGIDVSTRAYDAGHEVSPEMLSHANSWLMEGICATHYV